MAREKFNQELIESLRYQDLFCLNDWLIGTTDTAWDNESSR